MIKKILFTLLLSLLTADFLFAQPKPFIKEPIFVDENGNTIESEIILLKEFSEDLIRDLKMDTMTIFVDTASEQIRIHVIGKGSHDAPVIQITMRDDKTIIIHFYDFVQQASINQKIKQFLQKRNEVYDFHAHRQFGYFHYMYYIKPS